MKMKIEVGYEIKGYPVEFETENGRAESMKAYMERFGMAKESDENDG